MIYLGIVGKCVHIFTQTERHSSSEYQGILYPANDISDAEAIKAYSVHYCTFSWGAAMEGHFSSRETGGSIEGWRTGTNPKKIGRASCRERVFLSV